MRNLTAISIHAPHEGERHSSTGGVAGFLGISIHAPHEGERLLCHGQIYPRQLFQSTLPTRGSDLYSFCALAAFSISIHAPHEGERHCAICLFSLLIKHFNPRSPRGGATGKPMYNMVIR